ncbi:MAG: AmpG family muropeptide MFS transporter [Candidatus Cloacimonadota bacterium]|nr:MAG: AmpG family muropeptide MFS transporter [Candidatus Cloacimonadota bacterium]PIE78007.1 MAG: AmpG family muropeptide MFS transporter [Candidatus Delongbacteria bacterium]
MSGSTNFIDLIKSLRSKRMIIVFLLGFSSGLPIMLLYSTLKIWMRREGVDLSTIGYFSWITIPYTFNFMWSFLLDRFIPFKMGRRRSWLIITQLGLVISLILISLGDPVVSVPYLVLMGTILCIFSATQDIAVDAYRREILPDSELGIGASIGVYGYRVGMLMASGFGLWAVDPKTLDFSFNQMFLLMAALMIVGIFATYICNEPKMEGKPPSTIEEAVIEPFKEFLTRPFAIWILMFVIFFKMGDSIAGSMLGAYYVDVGFDNKTIAEVTKGIGFLSSMAGLFIGGWVIFKIGIYKSLWAFGFLQAISTAFLSILTLLPTKLALTSVIAFEDLSSGMGTSAMVAFMAGMTNRRFTATQYALFASLASFGRTFLSGFSGVLIESISYFQFFILCSILAIPGILLLIKMGKIESFQES